jgi:hypothetical protein
MDLQPGTRVAVVSDMVVNGQTLFTRGEQVIVEQVSPNAERPEYKYAVTSRTGQRFQLRGADVVPVQISQQPALLASPHPVQYQQPVRPKRRLWLKVGIPVVCILIAAGVAAYFIVAGGSSSPVAGKTYSLTSGSDFVRYNFYKDGKVLFNGSAESSVTTTDYYKVVGSEVTIYGDKACTDKKMTLFLSSDGTTLTAENGLELKKE